VENKNCSHNALQQVFQDLSITASSFEEMTEMSKAHGMEMFQKQDPEHLAAMQKIMAMMQDPELLEEWSNSKEKEFDALPED
jgi:hypothetical protein